MPIDPPRPAIFLAAFSILLIGCSGSPSGGSANPVAVDVILVDLLDPRGVAVMADGALLVAEAGLGDDARDVSDRTGRLTRFVDRIPGPDGPTVIVGQVVHISGF